MPLLLVAALPEVAVAVAMLVVLGVGYSLIETAGLTLLQRLTSDDVLGRAFAVVESSYWLTTGAGAMAAPAIVGLFGVRGALVAIGLCLPVVVALRWAGLARFEAGAAIPEAAFALLRSVPLFAPLSLGTLENVSRRLAEVEVSAGHAVVREGEPGERFYVIAEGEFEVSNSRGAFPLLGEGDVFGEIALLRDIPRTATVTARTDGLLYALDRESFLAAVAGHRFASRSADSMVHERTEQRPGQLSESGSPKRGNSCGVTNPVMSPMRGPSNAEHLERVGQVGAALRVVVIGPVGELPARARRKQPHPPLARLEALAVARPALGERPLAQEHLDRVAAAVPGGHRRHHHRGLLGEHRDDAVDVTALPGLHVAAHQLAQLVVVERAQRGLLALLGQPLVDSARGRAGARCSRTPWWCRACRPPRGPRSRAPRA